MDNFYSKMDKIISICTGLFFVFFILIVLLKKCTSFKLSPHVLLFIIGLIIIPIIIKSIIVTSSFLITLVKKKNLYLLAVYSALTFLIYIFADTHTSELVYNSLGYNPKYVPHTLSIISLISLLCIGLCITSVFMLLISVFASLISIIFNSFSWLYVLSLKENKLNKINDKLRELGCGSMFLAFFLLSMNLLIDEYINFSKIIQIIAINVDYHSIRHSGYICKEARNYEAFNYLSNNMISVYRYDELNKNPIFSIINCVTV